MDYLLTFKEEAVYLIILLFLYFYSNIFLDTEKAQYKRANLYAIAHVISYIVALFVVNSDAHVLIKNASYLCFLIFVILFCAEVFIYCFKVTICKTKKCLRYINIGLTFLIMILPFLPITYFKVGDHVGVGGPVIYVATAYILLLLVSSFLLLLVRFKYVPTIKKWLLIPLTLILSIMIIVDIILPKIMMTNSLVTVGVIGLFISMDNSLSKYKKAQSIDYSSGLKNRSYFEEDKVRINKDCFVKGDKNIICAILDINYLNQFNEKYGHLEGDNLIKVTAMLLKTELKSAYDIYRYSGDQFMVFYIGDKTYMFKQEINELMEASYKKGLLHCDPNYSISLAYGVQEKNKSIKDIDELINYADRNLYIEKQKARQNRFTN